MVFYKLKRIPFIEHTNSFIKSILQEHKAKRTLQCYNRKAKQKEIVTLQGVDLQKAIYKKLKARNRTDLPKSKGQLHIFLAYYTCDWEAILPLTLKPFGKVSIFDWQAHGFDDTKPDWLKYRDRMNSCMLQAFLKAHKEKPVDVVIGYLSGYNTSPDTLLHMSELGAVIFNFCWDDKLNFPGKKIGGRYNSPAAIANVVDLNLTNSLDSEMKYRVHGGLAMFWPPAGYPPFHRQHNIPFEYDVSFVGACYGRRPFFINRLKKLGIKVECFGKGWPNGIVSNEEIIKIYSRSRINLGFAGIGHSRKLMCLKGRDFQVPMSGGLYLTQNNPELELVFDVGNEIVTYTNEKNCARIICKLLNNPTLAEAIRQAGRKRCLNVHTYDNRWSQVFKLTGILQEQD